MAFSLARLHEAAVNKFKSVHGKLERHKETIGSIVSEAVRTGETVAGGGTAALVDFYLGDNSAIPEAMVGPVPVVLTGALALKGVAFALGRHPAASHLHAFSNGLAAAGTYATAMRTLKEHAAAA